MATSKQNQWSVYLVAAVLISYFSKYIDFSNWEMTQLEDVTQMYESQEQKALKRLKIG